MGHTASSTKSDTKVKELGDSVAIVMQAEHEKYLNYICITLKLPLDTRVVIGAFDKLSVSQYKTVIYLLVITDEEGKDLPYKDITKTGRSVLCAMANLSTRQKQVTKHASHFDDVIVVFPPSLMRY